MPEGYVVTGIVAHSGVRTIATAVSPKPFTQRLADMQTAYSTRGCSASQGEVEERDAESNFNGNGLRGRWVIRDIPDCTCLSSHNSLPTPARRGTMEVAGASGPDRRGRGER